VRLAGCLKVPVTTPALLSARFSSSTSVTDFLGKRMFCKLNLCFSLCVVKFHNFFLRGLVDHFGSFCIFDTTVV
jgi:hypothetical protein